jgi:hypothetical protein
MHNKGQGIHNFVIQQDIKLDQMVS